MKGMGGPAAAEVRCAVPAAAPDPPHPLIQFNLIPLCRKAPHAPQGACPLRAAIC